ncbi:MAG TPA: alpha/beta hydrolase [Anaerolineales bacterium]|nr:alpha/beta hydrolase [Anaerolineales bacterium]
MKTTKLLIAFLLFVTLLLAGCGTREAPVLDVPEGARAGQLAGLEACEYQPAGSKAKFAAECGTLVVPENWDKAATRLIALPVVRIPASGTNPAEPVFYLLGGPGLSNLSLAPPDWLPEDHDVVIVGYRGVDGTVRLACPDVTRLIGAHKGKDLFSEQARAEYAAAVGQCAAAHQAAGVDLAGYTVPNVVEDLEAARLAFGYDRINLFSQSFGTRIAQLYAYLHPGSLHRLVLFGIAKPGSLVDDPAVFDQMIERISELCAQDAACSRRTDDFAQTMYAVNHNMPRRWLFFNIDPATVRVGAHFAFMSARDMPMALDAYLAAAEGDPSGLAMANLYTSLQPIEAQLYGDQASKAGTLDADQYAGIESVSLGDSIMGAPLSELFWPMVEAWPIELAPEDLREFQATDVQMLLVNGSLDFSTPPMALDEARPYFHNAQIVLLPEFGHTNDVRTLQPEAFERLVTSYYQTGVADDSLFVYQPLSFEPAMRLTVVGKALVAAMVGLPALLVLGVVLVVRRIRRRRAVRFG